MLRKPLKFAAWVLGSVAGSLALLTALVLIAGNTDPGRAMIERITAQLTGGMVQLSGLGGSFPTRLTLRHLELTDKQGVWLTADAIALTWTPLALLERRISVDSLEVAHVDMERTPHSSGGGGTPPFRTSRCGASISRTYASVPSSPVGLRGCRCAAAWTCARSTIRSPT